MLTEYFEAEAHRTLNDIVIPVLRKYVGLDNFAQMFREAEVEQHLTADITGYGDAHTLVLEMKIDQYFIKMETQEISDDEWAITILNIDWFDGKQDLEIVVEYTPPNTLILDEARFLLFKLSMPE